MRETRNVVQIELVPFKKKREGWKSILPIDISKILKIATVITYMYNSSQKST